MIKLLIMNDYVHDGGVEKVMEEIVNYLPQEDYNITIATTITDYESINRFYPSYVHYMPLEKAFKRSKNKNIVNRIINSLKRRFFKCIYRWKINADDYDVVIAIKEGECMKFLSKVKARKKYAWIHVDYNYLHWTKGIFGTYEKELECMKTYDNVICVSKSTKESVCDVIGNPGNLIVKFNPMNVKEIVRKSEEAKKDIDGKRINQNKIVLVTVGGLREQKGYMRLLQACKKLNEDKFNYELWIIGNGPMYEDMEEYIRKNELGNVILWGNQNNPYPFIKRGDWFISSSYWESYGLAVQEAFILNVPVLATKCPAFEECINLDKGILVENDDNSLYNGLRYILENPEIKNKYAGLSEKHESLYIKRLEAIEELWKEKR